MDRSNRFFDIIQILRAAEAPVTAAMLAEELEVTTRTIYRDIASLQARRIPIEGEAGIGYVMRPGFDLPPLMFDAEELEALTVGLALLGRTADHRLQLKAEQVARKIADIMPEGRDYPVPLFVSSWHDMPTTNTDPALLRHFIREEMTLKITYQDERDCLTERMIQPIALIYHVDAVILAAWCELRMAFRHFRIDRIMNCEPSGAVFRGEGGRLRHAWEEEREAFYRHQT